MLELYSTVYLELCLGLSNMLQFNPLLLFVYGGIERVSLLLLIWNQKLSRSNCFYFLKIAQGYMWRSKSFFFFMFGVGFVPPSWSSFCDSCCNSLYFFVWLVSPEGIEALCKDVNVDHTDIRMLILAWYVTDGIFFSIYLYLTNLLTFINLCLFLLGN